MSLWINGTTRSGKTARLVAEFRQWVGQRLSRYQKRSRVASAAAPRQQNPSDKLASAILVLAANNHNRYELGDRLAVAVEGSYPVICKTPVGFVTDEVMLFWPILFERLNLKAQFPLRLRPETEQELATKLWRTQSDWEELSQTVGEYRLVRQALDLLQLAGASGTEAEDIPLILEEGWLSREEKSSLNTVARNEQLWQRMAKLLLQWRQWCLERGLLTYGIIYELYWRYLLPDSTYQQHLTRRYQAIFADDVDDYPAIAREIFDFLLDRGAFAVFTYNPDGKIRLGLNADPNYLAGLASRCRLEELSPPIARTIGTELANLAIELVTATPFLVPLPNSMESIQTISRAELLRKTAAIIIQAVNKGEIEPAEIAIIAPGLDEIARYSLIEMLSASGIAVDPLNEQRPLISSPTIRALLTLLALVYPGLGRLVDRDSIAEMLVMLSSRSVEGRLVPAIDPVRAGLLADYCYRVDPEQPYLLSVESFARWDRLGHKATAAYGAIAQWIEQTKSQQQQQGFLSPISLLDRAIAHFLGNSNHLPYDLLAALRELMETVQHFWEVDRRLRQNEPSFQTQTATVAQLIQLLRRGTITANPRPVRSFEGNHDAVVLATIFQYRSLRSSHRWQFWLDASSPLWNKGGAATLLAAPLFLKEWSGRTWMPEDDYEMDRQRLQRILRDLLGRVEEKVFLCHSDLGVNGTEQTGPLLPLVHASRQFVTEKIAI
ncbi:recombinase family protein [Pleurocapsales cyanobacterium LEGE 06147]|nr:recombinase family protein [Pleurocapsales cyanobacterium LEGE 06147]